MSDAARVRTLPFLAFMLLALRGALPPQGAWGIDPRWIYGLTVLVVGGMLLAWRKDYGELARQNLPDAAQLAWTVAAGLGAFALWIQLDAPWMTLGETTTSFVPLDAAGANDWPLVALRWIGATLMVPLMEELFWRSFLMRGIPQPGFETVDPAQVGLRAVIISTFLFVRVHPLWLAAALAGLAYAWLYIRTRKLWCCVIAHAVTNGALGIWVVFTRQWQFW